MMLGVQISSHNDGITTASFVDNEDIKQTQRPVFKVELWLGVVAHIINASIQETQTA